MNRTPSPPMLERGDSLPHTRLNSSPSSLSTSHRNHTLESSIIPPERRGWFGQEDRRSGPLRTYSPPPQNLLSESYSGQQHRAGVKNGSQHSAGVKNGSNPISIPPANSGGPVSGTVAPQSSLEDLRFMRSFTGTSELVQQSMWDKAIEGHQLSGDNIPVSEATRSQRNLAIQQDSCGTSSGRDGCDRTPTVLSKDTDSLRRTYTTEKVIGSGSFGTVFKARVAETGQTVAIKRVVVDPRFKNREMAVLTLLQEGGVVHPNIVELKNAFNTRDGSHKDRLSLNLVMEYLPYTMSRVMRHYERQKEYVPSLYAKLFSYQLCKAVGYMGAKGIVHRDLKPQNILVDFSGDLAVKVCDFGSAKKLEKDEANLAYICSRYYRAPELMFGSTGYGTKVDVWGVGCIIAEIFSGAVAFKGNSSVEQLVEIIKVLGLPTTAQLSAMNPKHTQFHFPPVSSISFARVFKKRNPQPAFVAFLKKILQYEPDLRPSGLELLGDPWFDELRNPAKGSPMEKIVARLSGLRTWNEVERTELRKMDTKLRDRILNGEKIESASSKNESSGGNVLRTSPESAKDFDPRKATWDPSSFCRVQRGGMVIVDSVRTRAGPVLDPVAENCRRTDEEDSAS